MRADADISAFTRDADARTVYCARIARVDALRRRHAAELTGVGVNLLNNVFLSTWDVIRDLGVEGRALCALEDTRAR